MDIKKLTEIQSSLMLEINSIRAKIIDREFMLAEEIKGFLSQIDSCRQRMEVNEAEIRILIDDDSSKKSLVNEGAPMIFLKTFREIRAHLMNMQAKIEKPNNPKRDEASGGDNAEIRDLRNQLFQLTNRLHAMEVGGKGEDSNGVIAELLLEMKAARVPLKFPTFPKDNVVTKFREWRQKVKNFEKTNCVEDSVKVQFLHEAAKNTAASELVERFTPGFESFIAAMEALDNRYLIARNIATEFVNSAFNLTAKGGKHSKHLKDVLDTFNSIFKNMEGLCRESLGAKGNDEPSVEVLQKTMINAIFLGMLMRTLDDSLRTYVATNMKLETLEIPDFKAVLAVLEKRFVATQSGEEKPTTVHVNFAQVVKNAGQTKRSCIVCNNNSHVTSTCRKLASSGTFSQKIKLLKSNPSKTQLCWICLEKPYSTCDCKTRGRKCQICQGSHHKILCNSQRQQSDSKANVKTEPNGKRVALLTVASSTADGSQAMLGTLMVKARAKNGDILLLRAMVDNGSMVSFVTTHVVQQLGLKIENTLKNVTAVDGQPLDNIEREVVLELFDMNGTFTEPFVVREVAVTRKIPLTLPAKEVDFNFPKKISREINLADPNFNVPQGIDIILGVEPWATMQLENSINYGTIRLQNTIFGHIVQGALGNRVGPSSNMIVATVITSEALKEIKRDFRQVFEYEHLAEEENEYAETLFSQCHKRLPNGKYEVPLIFGTDKGLGDSYNVCFKRNQRLLEKLSPDQVEKVIGVLKEYRDQGIIKVCEDEKKGSYYCPFVLVWRDKLTSPLRICLDASQKSTNGLSANDIQLVGPPLQPSIVQQLLKFRQFPFCVISDITQMYLMIEIRKEDRKFQRSILNLPGYETQEIEYSTVLFGSTCAPYLAQRVIKQLAIDEKGNFPLGCEILATSAYVDDIIFSCESIEKGQEILRQLVKATSSAKFELHKIASNDDRILKNVDEKRKLSNIDKSGKIAVLGVQWDYRTDEMFVKISLKPIVKLTKRVALSIAASIFDPLGLVSPVVMPARFLIQEIWLRDRQLKKQENLQTWDNELPADLAKKFMIWCEGLRGIDDIRIKRNVNFDKNLNQTIVVFTDASLKGYGAVAYLRSISILGKVEFTILASKGKVSPVVFAGVESENLSIVRLELMAALVGAQLAQTVREAWNLNEKFPVQLFTDSEIVLARITSEVIRDVFSENRLRKIRQLVPRENWFHVATDHNPADLISRGSLIGDLEGLWVQGPKIMHDANFMPTNKFSTDEMLIVGITMLSHERFQFLSTSMSFHKSIRIMAWFRRSITARKKKPKFDGKLSLTREELDAAKISILKIVQQKYYADQIKNLMRHEIINHGDLKTKNPFIDRDGILRIGSRIQLAEFDYDERNPIVLPPIRSDDKENHVSYQVIADAHHDNIHGGITSTIADIKQKFFIPGLRAGVSKIISKCQRCAIIRAKVKTQIMGNLPKEIVLKNPSFYHSTLDYMGPIAMRNRYRRTKRNVDDVEKETFDKCWVLLIACFTTGAYHLELVPDLEANSFLRAFECFVATRGVPFSVRSDNSTTFHKSKKLLDGAYEKFNKSLIDGDNAIKGLCVAKNIRWNFNPPLASAFGGKHERGIRSVREKMRRSIGLTKLSYINLHVCLKKIELILNSRPLIRARGVHEEGDFVITPGHFLIGRPLNMLPTNVFPTKNVSLREAYNIRMQIENKFWELFHKSHLQEIASRAKWYRETEEVKIDDLVLLKEDNTPSLGWRKGVVIKTFNGPDGKVRVVKLRTAYGEFDRPIGKIVVIPWGEARFEENDGVQIEQDIQDQNDSQGEPNAQDLELGKNFVEDAIETDLDRTINPITDLMVTPTDSQDINRVDEPIDNQADREIVQTDKQDLDELLGEIDNTAQVISQVNDQAEQNLTRDQSQIKAQTVTQSVNQSADENAVVQSESNPLQRSERVKTKVTKDDNVSKDSPPLRRSSRVPKKRNLFSALVAMMMVITMVTADQHPVRVNSSHGGGAIIYENGRILLSEGIFHILVDTGASAINDSRAILKVLNRFQYQCNRANDVTTVKCGGSWYTAYNYAKEALEKIEEVTSVDLQAAKKFYWTNGHVRESQIKEFETQENLKSNDVAQSRAKREVGFFWKLLSWAFSLGGSDSNDELLHPRSAGVLSHALRSIKNVEESLTKHDRMLTDEFDRLAREVLYQGKNSNRNAIESQLTRASIAVRDYIRNIMVKYDNHGITDAEFLLMKQSIDSMVLGKQAKVPDLHLDHLKPLLTFENRYEQKLIISVGFPLVSLNEYHRITIVPFPDEKTQVIIDSEVADVIINSVLLRYADANTAKLTKINETLSIAEIQIMSLIADDTKCLVRLASLDDQTCGVIPFSKEKEFWFMTPLHNVVQFISFKKKALICPANRTEINDPFGVISIPAQCFIKTANRIIRATLDETKITKSMAKVTLDNVDLALNQSIVASKNFTMKVPDNVATGVIVESSLEQDITELDAIEKERWEYYWVMIFISLNGTIVLVVLCICIYHYRVPLREISCMRRKRKPTTVSEKVESSKEQESIELENLDVEPLTRKADHTLLYTPPSLYCKDSCLYPSLPSAAQQKILEN